jgi:hypothetical protein
MLLLTGGEVITEEMGLKLENTKLSQLGRARRIGRASVGVGSACSRQQPPRPSLPGCGASFLVPAEVAGEGSAAVLAWWVGETVGHSLRSVLVADTRSPTGLISEPL